MAINFLETVIQQEQHQPFDFETPNYRKILEELGNGNALAGMAHLTRLAIALSTARIKHPVFAIGAAHALGVVGAEYVELVDAVDHETEERQTAEAWDVVVTAWRMATGEHKNGAA